MQCDSVDRWESRHPEQYWSQAVHNNQVTPTQALATLLIRVDRSPWITKMQLNKLSKWQCLELFAYYLTLTVSNFDGKSGKMGATAPNLWQSEKRETPLLCQLITSHYGELTANFLWPATVHLTDWAWASALYTLYMSIKLNLVESLLIYCRKSEKSIKNKQTIYIYFHQPINCIGSYLASPQTGTPFSQTF